LLFCGGKAFRFSVRTAHSYPPAVDEAVRAFLALTNRDRIVASNRAFCHYRRSVDVIPDTDLGVTEPAGVWKHLRTGGVSGARYDEGDRAVYVLVV
jgi:hypothetical protein